MVPLPSNLIGNHPTHSRTKDKIRYPPEVEPRSSEEDCIPPFFNVEKPKINISESGLKQRTEYKLDHCLCANSEDPLGQHKSQSVSTSVISVCLM